MKTALVKKAIAPLLLRPEPLCELADEVLCGWQVEILEELPDGWCKVKTHYNYTGYTHKDNLELDSQHTAWWEALPKRGVTRFTADVLTAPKVQGGHIETLTLGAWVSVTGSADDNGWLPVVLCDGRAGYMKEGFLGNHIAAWDPKDEGKLREAIVAAAFRYIGCQYRWGGRTPLGIDCSGLCHQSYLMNGIIIHRDASMQPGFPMKPIPRERLERADLIFFKGHVAMYLGNDRFLHSTSKSGSDGVVINSFDPRSPDYREDLSNGILAMGSVFRV